jgi:hypothetical protein
MGFIASLFQSGPELEKANIVNTTNAQQIAQAQQGSQAAIGQQQNFVNALAAQNGLGNQTQVYNQLQQQIAGNGPSVAQNQLNQATGQNVANTAATMASARGAGANAGMIARQAGMAGANVQQQAAGQAATLRAQEQLGAMGQAGQMATNQAQQQAQGIAGLNQASQNHQNMLMNAQGQTNAQNVAMQSNINNARTSVYNQQSQMAGDLVGGVMQGAGSAAMMMSDENQKQNVAPADAEVQAFLDSMSAHGYEYKDPAAPGAGAGHHVSPMAQELEKTPMGASMVVDTPHGKMVDYGKGMGAIVAAQAHLNKRLEAIEGKKPQNLAMGGAVDSFMGGYQPVSQGPAVMSADVVGLGGGQGSPGLQQGVASLGAPIGKALKGNPMQGEEIATMAGDPVQAVPMKPGALPLDPMMIANKGGMASVKDKLKSGGSVPGKAKVKGDDIRNDTVHAMLSPGEIVIPRSIVNSKDAPKKAAQFVQAILAKQNLKSKAKGK